MKLVNLNIHHQLTTQSRPGCRGICPSLLCIFLLSFTLKFIALILFPPGPHEPRQRGPICHQWRWLLLAEGNILLWHWHASLDDHIERWPTQLYRWLGDWRLLHRVSFPGHQHLCGHPVWGIPPWVGWVRVGFEWGDVLWRRVAALIFHQVFDFLVFVLLSDSLLIHFLSLLFRGLCDLAERWNEHTAGSVL